MELSRLQNRRNLQINNGQRVRLGEIAWHETFACSTPIYEGYMSDVYFVDGQALEPEVFGKYFGDPGKWGPLDSSDVYKNINFGANGFHLPFNPDEGIETDASGQDNHFTDENFVLTGNTQDTVKDTPMRNYAVLESGTNR